MHLPLHYLKHSRLLLAANAIPVVGVLTGQWYLSDILLIYWLESAVIGIFNVCKMLIAGSWVEVPLKLILIPFFIFHYGMFMFGHYTVLSGIVSGNMQYLANPNLQLIFPLWPAILGMFINHGTNFINYVRQGSWRHEFAGALMFKPYGRIMLMHFLVIIGAILVTEIGQFMGLIIIIAVLKTIGDLIGQRWDSSIKVSNVSHTPKLATPIPLKYITLLFGIISVAIFGSLIFFFVTSLFGLNQYRPSTTPSTTSHVQDSRAHYAVTYDSSLWHLTATPETVPHLAEYENLELKLTNTPHTYVFFRPHLKQQCSVLGRPNTYQWWTTHEQTILNQHPAIKFSGEEQYYYHEAWWVTIPSGCLKIGIFDATGYPHQQIISDLLIQTKFE